MPAHDSLWGAGAGPSNEQVGPIFSWLKEVKSHSHAPEMYAHDPRGIVFKKYQEILLSCNAVDFDDIIIMVGPTSSVHMPKQRM